MKFGFSFGYGGGLSGTPPILQGDYIWYSLDPDTGFLAEPMRKINDEGNTIMVGASGQHNGTMYSGKSVELSGDGVVKIPVNATLGDEDFNGTFTHTSGFDEVDNGDGTFTYTCNADGSNQYCYIRLSNTGSNGSLVRDIPAGLHYKVEMPITQISMSDEFICQSNDWDLEVEYIIEPTVYIAEGVSDGDINSYIKVGGTSEQTYLAGDSFTVDVANITIKEITQVQGSVTVFNFDTKEFEQVWVDGTDSKELIVNGDFSEDPSNSYSYDPAGYQWDSVNKTMGYIGDGVGIYLSQNYIFSKDKKYRLSIEMLHADTSNFLTDYTFEGYTPFNTTGTHVVTGTTRAGVDQNFRLKGTGSTAVFDNISVREVLPLSTTYDLTDGTYGTICKLHTASFTQEDLVLFTSNPELLLQWYWNEITIPSGLVKSADDKVYIPHIDGYYFELDYQEGNELRDYTKELPCLRSTYTDNGDGTATITTTDDTNLPYGYLRLSLSGNNPGLISDVPAGRLIHTFTEAKVSDHAINGGFRRATGWGLDTNYETEDDTYRKIDRFLTSDGSTDSFYGFYPPFKNNETMTIKIDTISFKEVLSDYIPIEGTYTYTKNLPYGIQDMRLELNDAGVPTKVLTNHQIRFTGKGDYVNTGVSIDGSKSDFTAMMGWKADTTGVNHVIATSGGTDTVDNKFELRINDDDTVTAVMGKNVFDMTPMLDPNAPVHAMCAVYNQSTGEVLVGGDGSTLTSMGTITFDGATGAVRFACDKSHGFNYDGYIGEGILSAAQEDENTWQLFWERIQTDECDRDKPAGEFLTNHSFDCGMLGWSFDPAYPATITDNGDGSLHLKTDSDFGSLVPNDQTFDAADWVIEVKFRNQVGNGKVSFRRPNNSWVSTPTIGDGVHQSNPFSGAIKEIHVGADGDSTYEADYEYISLRKRNN